MYNVTLQNFKTNDNINNNIYNRNISSSSLEPNLEVRPVSTKYAIMPILDHRVKSSVILNNRTYYNSEETFNPSNRKPHYSGFAINIDGESCLRNQFFALQKGDQSKYIPGSDSDMYISTVNTSNSNINTSNSNINNHVNNDVNNSLLFRKENFNDFNPNLSNNIGHELFNNSTRVQLKNLK